MLYIVFTTGRCNLNCSYCGGSFPEGKVPSSPRYRVEDLRRFIEGDEEPIIAFYGGEPLLNASFMEEVMDEVDWARFVVQTNATLIDRLPPKYWRRMDAVLVSIDGRREVTDAYRGSGVYDRAVEASRRLREMGFRGDLVARMTISRLSDVYLDVLHLLSLGLFDHVHWQLDVVWSPRWEGVEEWASRYVEGLSRLHAAWLGRLVEGEVLGIAPFKALTWHALTGRPVERPPCGAGSSSLAVLTDGSVLACPIAVDEAWARVGRVTEDVWSRCVGRTPIEEPCPSCPHVELCGGRCLYANRERLWGEEGFRLVCGVTIALLELVRSSKGVVEDAVRRGVVELDELRYPRFNNTVEVVP